MKLYLTGLALACLSVITACSPREVKIGVTLPLSGQSAPRGEDMLNAAVLAVEEQNQAGGINGKRISLHIEDDRDDPEKALAIAQSLVNSDVLAVIGHYSSTATQMTLPTYAKAHLALVSPAVALTYIPGEGQTFFRTLNANHKQATSASQWIHQLQYHHVAVVHNPSIYGRDLAQQMLIALRQAPASKIPARITVIEDDGTEATLQKLQADIPELVFYAGGYQAAAHFLNALFSRGIAVDWMGGRPLWEHDFARLLGVQQAQNGWVMATPLTPEAEAFYTHYTQRFGRPGPFAYTTYTALQHTFQALAQSGKKMTRESVSQALQQHFAHYRPPAATVFSLRETGEFVPAETPERFASTAGQSLGKPLAALLKTSLQIKPAPASP